MSKVNLPTMNLPIQYEEQLEQLKDFLQSFKTTVSEEEQAVADLENLNLGGETATPRSRRKGGRAPRTPGGRRAPVQVAKYMDMLQEISDRKRDAITVDLDDLHEYEIAQNTSHNKFSLVNCITKNALHYVEIVSRAIDAVLPPQSVDISVETDVLDVIMTQRRARNLFNEQEEQDAAERFPPALTRRYQVYFKPLSAGTDHPAAAKSLSVRQVKGEHLGHLITISGIATRVSDVKPSVEINAYSCDRCGCEIFQEVKSKQFTPMTECPSKDCVANAAKGQLFMSTRASKFLPYQDIKIQEMAHQVPIGHIPRTITVQCHGPLVRSINPGDQVDIAGIFLPTPYTGFRAVKAGLITDTYLEAQYVHQHKQKYVDIKINAETERRAEELRANNTLYDMLAKSIAPEIFGHEDVKKCLLLLLIGGVTKEMGDGMRIRGDINVCLMGDPGVAKSQLLKFVTKVAPRGVYTTGRGSSGVGLTAAVMRDPVTDEMVLEGGALVLADNGICCIDEFDKMDDADRTAIHEVMEQQTISISKAGITTTLNARTSILAAANPLMGRYNPKISPVENINLPAALLSRFDIVYLILDTPDRQNDEELGRHVTYVHMHNEQPPMEFEPFTQDQIRTYIAKARTFRPTVGKEVAEYMTGAYVRMRQQQKRDEARKRLFSHVSPRTLLGILRLSQALARLRFSNEVIIEDVDEALRLIEVSKASLYEKNEENADNTYTTKIYNIIRAMYVANQSSGDDEEVGLSMNTIRERILAKGFTQDQLIETIEEYETLNILQINSSNNRLVFIDMSGFDDDEDMDF